MSNNIHCPYCEKYQLIQPDNNRGDCVSCKKTFIYFKNFTAHKADCLNGGEHSYIPRGCTGWPDRKTCGDCGHDVKGEYDSIAVQLEIESEEKIRKESREEGRA